MWKQFSIRGNNKWIDILPDLISIYNDTKHRSIKMKPNDVSAMHEERLVKALNQCKLKIKKPKFKVGDYVHISKYKGVFEKSYTPN